VRLGELGAHGVDLCAVLRVQRGDLGLVTLALFARALHRTLHVALQLALLVRHALLRLRQAALLCSEGSAQLRRARPEPTSHRRLLRDSCTRSRLSLGRSTQRNRALGAGLLQLCAKHRLPPRHSNQALVQLRHGLGAVSYRHRRAGEERLHRSARCWRSKSASEGV